MLKIKRSILSFLLFSLFMAGQSLFAEELVIKLELDTNSTAALSSTEKSYASTIYNQFMRDILMVPEISVRTSDVDSTLREIQLQSQVDAGIGMGSDDAVYASDKGSRATLSMLLKLVKAANSVQFTCDISEIETMKLIGSKSVKASDIKKVSDEQVDEFAYEVLLTLQQRGYISVLPSSVINQLLGKETSAENFEKYIKDYTEQIEAAEREKQALEKNAKTAEEIAYAADQARVLQLKIEMLEKSRQQAEENLRRQQAEQAQKAKQEKELESYRAEKQEEFQKKVKQLEEMRSQIRNEASSQLSLKKRIELIESGKANLADLKSQLEDSIVESNTYFDQKCEEEAARIQNEEWRRGETDANGNPTSMAKKIRNQEIKAVREKYASAKNAAEAKLRQTIQPSIDGYEEQINTNISELQKTTYVFRSIDKTDDFLSLNVDQYDANDGSWTVHSDIQMDSIPKINIESFFLPDADIAYKTMTGKNLPNLNNPSKSEYDEYLDLVDMSDLYFRTSVPYLYSEIALTVTYSQRTDNYVAYPVYFRIHKTEDRTKLFEYKKSDFDGDKRKALSVAAAKTAEEKKKAKEAAAAAAKAEREAEKEEERKASAAKKTQAKYDFSRMQTGRNGLYAEMGYIQGSIYSGLDMNFQCYMGNDYWFYGMDLDIALAGFTETTSISESIPYCLIASDLIGGLCVNLGDFTPYLSVGLGVAGTDLIQDSTGESLPLFTCCVAAGVDYNVEIFSLGFTYRWRYVYGAGFSDSYNISVGLVW